MRAHPYLRFVLVRLGALVLLAVGITLVSFLLTNLIPGDPAAANLGQRALSDPAIVASFRHQHGLDQPLPVQYWKYLTGLLHGDFGTSQRSNRPVIDELAEYVPATLELAITAVVVALVVGVGLGMLAATRRNSWLDQLLRVVSLAGVSMPTFWLALAAFFVLFYKLGILPGGGRLDPGLDAPPQVTGMYTVDALLSGQWDIFGNAVFHLIMPALVLAAYTVGLLTRFTRASMLEVLGNDYIRTAHAKGLPGRTIVFRHVLRPALVPILTVAGLAFSSLLSGTVLVEQIFSWNGIGQYAYQSALNLDLPAIMGVSLVVAVIYVTVNFAVDLLYGVVDPRVRLQ